MPQAAENLIGRVARIITRYNILAPGDRCGVAVSGGADSMALLHILQRLSSSLEIRLLLLHVNHQLRGADSEADQAFVCELAESLGLSVVIEQAPVGLGNLEEEARQARRAFFRRAMDQRGLRCVALGHTRSDQAETVLFRLIRGSGLAGLAGMQIASNEGLMRPLLTTSREELRQWLHSEGIEWREDSSNESLRFARNRLRKEAIPLLCDAVNRNLEGAIAGTAELARDEEDYWSDVIEPIYEQIGMRERLGWTCAVSSLYALPKAVRRRVVRRALTEVRGNLRSIDMEHVEAILGICDCREGHNRVIVPGCDALRSFGTLLLAREGAINGEPRDYYVEVSFDSECELPFQSGFVRVNLASPGRVNYGKFEEAQEFPAEIAYLTAHLLGGPGRLAVRNWQPGDALQRSGHEGIEKVKSLFQEHRVLLWERRHWPVLVAGEEVVWVRGFGAAAKFSAAAGEGPAVCLQYRPADDIRARAE